MTAHASSSYVWFRESDLSGVEMTYLCDDVVLSTHSRYQQIDIVDTRIHGRMLFLDGIAQSAARDEFIYHEMLVHPAMFHHPQPRSVLIIGGAEGATLREVLRHGSVERVVMVDIDGELVEICKEYLPQWHQGGYLDPRLELIIGDGRSYVTDCAETFDVVIVDLSDPLEGSPAVLLFTREFYRLLHKRLSPDGVMVLQGESVSPQEMALHVTMVNTLRAVFPLVAPYSYMLHSFHRPDAHILVKPDGQWPREQFWNRIEQAALPLRYFSPQMARGMFALPPYLVEAYEAATDIATDSKAYIAN